MAALEARSLLTCETIRSPNALYPAGLGGIIGIVGGLRRHPQPRLGSLATKR
jgi:hypothetical protein